MTAEAIYDNEIDNYSVVPLHSCSLLWTQEIKVGSKVERLVRLRNPWGYREWNGEWSILVDGQLN